MLQHGMTYGDLHEHNILDLHGRPVLPVIDLASTESHICGLRMKTLPGAMKLTVEEYGCAELHDLIVRMGLWNSGSSNMVPVLVSRHAAFLRCEHPQTLNPLSGAYKTLHTCVFFLGVDNVPGRSGEGPIRGTLRRTSDLRNRQGFRYVPFAV